ncbi:DUF3833 family protein [Oceaniglobus roseus]|uniref:DUF3833 family protein n=1 Tax=Oceaniglobus roseus TaxID=1737570 RepID=UPI000C7F5A9C|nr:DUF3833 family protein [Kandeliimicrobium roseum]
MDIALTFLFGVAVAAVVVALRVRFLSFRAQSPADYDGLSPQFDIRRHLSGPIRCEGVIYGPFGKVTSRFTARMQGDWSGDTGVLSERFLYDNGDIQERAWHLRIGNDGAIHATADDVPGAGEGWQKGPTVLLSYPIRLPPEAGGHTLTATDWMYLIGDGVIINRSQFRKFGIKVAELVATMRPEDRG